MDFWKMNGLGNDYVYILDLERKINNECELAINVSDRNFGIGSDGLVLIRTPENENCDFRMDMYNADGSSAEMCGNAIRCVGKYVFDNKLTTKKQLLIETLAGVKELFLNTIDEKVVSVKVNMGTPVLKGELIPVNLNKDKIINEKITVLGKDYFTTCVSMGNPHSVIYVDDVDCLKLDEIGTHFENHKLFPKRVNTEFVQVIDKNNLKMRVYERGTGETLACGTGACAVVVASVLNNKSNEKVNVHLKGGILEIEYNLCENIVYMTGSCEVQFVGKYLK